MRQSVRNHVPAVSNSSPLILYAAVNRVDVLQAVFGEIVVPSAVWHEVVAEGAGRPGASEVLQLPSIRQHWLESDQLARRLSVALDPGEAEAIAPAVQLGRATPLLLDDPKGRRLAREQGVTVIGRAGSLLAAKERGFLPAVRPLLDDLVAAGLSLSDTAKARVA